MKVTFARTRPEDRDAFWALYQDAYKALILEQFGGWDDAEQYAAFLRKWQQQGYVRILADGEMAGGLWLRFLPTHHEIADIQLYAGMRNRGIGSAIIRREIERAQAQGKPLRLSVLFKNRACRLYRRLGFRVVGQSAYQHHLEV
ncbi:GNAT family N-acetyltransferase [Verticiella sediminum]|uniref:GNAT family N-acetyltransferase n=1 Tax=Verticiella sediminum TaxID=1247510 RepID=A0A556AJ61_9BURK|nr:GNAT family N-acetyltransferase [Verticiella sediminum]TSH92944.1 GNAT family N-acetyltransferase [Verticiella sediminum]